MSEARDPGDGLLVAATYNVHGCIGTDGRYDVARVARVIRALEADVVGLQEVDAGYLGSHSRQQIEDLEEATGMRAVAGPTLLRERGSFGNALLTRWPVRSVNRINVSWRHREPRGAIDAEVLWRDHPVRVVVTHFGLSSRERLAQARAILEALDSQSRRLTIVMGDFNEWMGVSRTLRLLNRRLGAAHAPRSFPARFPLFRLDRIWVRPLGQLVDVARADKPPAPSASDHRPVVARVVKTTPEKGLV